MRNFEQLSQDEQMAAVECCVEEIITSACHGKMPDCFLAFRQEIEQVISTSFLSRKAMLQELINERHDIKISMLHEAGSLAKGIWYRDPGDIVVDLH